jgi:SnoaL-like protein
MYIMRIGLRDKKGDVSKNTSGSTLAYTAWFLHSLGKCGKWAAACVTNTKVRTLNNNTAVVVCLENIQTTSANGRVIRFGIIATNIFDRNELNHWLIIHHHGSPVTNYIPPNPSSHNALF